jgi:PhnB protein
MQLNPHLHFNGDCEEALRFYEKCLGGKITLMLPYEGTPVADRVPAAWCKKILHSELSIGDGRLTAADVPPENYEKPQGFSVTLNIKDPADAERIFHAMSENSAVQLPLQETFWAAQFGMLVDRFGIPWMINCGKPG